MNDYAARLAVQAATSAVNALGEIPGRAVLDLLAAVLQALDIPHPATVGDTEAHDRILAVRVDHARIALESVLRDGGPLVDIGWEADYLRARLAEHPANGYRPLTAPVGDESR